MKESKNIHDFLLLTDIEQLISIKDTDFKKLESDLTKINKKFKEVQKSRLSEYRDRLRPINDNLRVFTGLSERKIKREMSIADRDKLREDFMIAMNDKEQREEYLAKF